MRLRVEKSIEEVGKLLNEFISVRQIRSLKVQK
jgi:hypothetical protein